MNENIAKDIEKLHEMIANASHAVFFGGAGMSTESGIPDFRGSGGLYTSEGAGNEYYLSRACLIGDSVPKCERCGATIRPDVTLYGEALDGFTWREAENEIAEADLLIVGGSSLTVYPAASLVGNFEGRHLVIINYSETAYDEKADLVIRGSVGEVLANLASLE